MAEAGELTQTSMVRAGMRLWSTSADVPEEGPNKEPAMQGVGMQGVASLWGWSIGVSVWGHRCTWA